MNIELKMNAFCVGKNEQLGSDGKTKYYNLAVVQNGQAGNISCSQDVYNQVLTNGAAMEQYDFTCVYRDGQYKGLRVTHAGISGSIIGGGSPQSTSADKGKK